MISTAASAWAPAGVALSAKLKAAQTESDFIGAITEVDDNGVTATLGLCVIDGKYRWPVTVSCSSHADAACGAPLCWLVHTRGRASIGRACSPPQSARKASAAAWPKLASMFGIARTCSRRFSMKAMQIRYLGQAREVMGESPHQRCPAADRASARSARTDCACPSEPRSGVSHAARGTTVAPVR